MAAGKKKEIRHRSAFDAGCWAFSGGMDEAQEQLRYAIARRDVEWIEDFHATVLACIKQEEDQKHGEDEELLMFVAGQRFARVKFLKNCEGLKNSEIRALKNSGVPVTEKLDPMGPGEIRRLMEQERPELYERLLGPLDKKAANYEDMRKAAIDRLDKRIKRLKNWSPVPNFRFRTE